MTKLRLIFRKTIGPDYDGRMVGYEYLTKIVDVPLEEKLSISPPEVIGGEWLNKQEATDGK